jgi:Tat protein secretion system quality control protein TatD with DNase activity
MSVWMFSDSVHGDYMAFAEKLAEIKQMKLTEVAEITTANARRMFNLIDL